MGEKPLRDSLYDGAQHQAANLVTSQSWGSEGGVIWHMHNGVSLLNCAYHPKLVSASKNVTCQLT